MNEKTPLTNLRGVLFYAFIAERSSDKPPEASESRRNHFLLNFTKKHILKSKSITTHFKRHHAEFSQQ